MAPKNLALPLKIRRTKPAELGKPTNLYILPANRIKGREIARDRYGWSLSHLVNKLLSMEIDRKKGVVNAFAKG